MLYLRILSALIGIPIILGLVYLGGPFYALFLLLVANLGILEYNNLLQSQDYQVPFLLNHLGVTLIIVLIFLGQQVLFFPSLILLFFFLFVAALFRMDRISVADSALSMWGIIYIGGLLGYMLMLRLLPEGIIFTYILLGGVWIHDTIAYFIGINWGSHKFAPQISPKKSVEGSLAGIIGTAVIFFIFALFYPDLIMLSPLKAIILATGIAVFSQIGDLLESALKRQFQVKDSSELIPGHGGILDRFDSLMIAAPFVYYYFLLVNLF